MENKKLILSVTKKDIDITYFNGSGAGGQHRNRKKCCVRMHHRDSGGMATGQDSRDKKTNTENAFMRLLETEKFKIWERAEVSKRMLNVEKLENRVKNQMKEHNLKFEVRSGTGQWIEIDPELIGRDENGVD